MASSLRAMPVLPTVASTAILEDLAGRIESFMQTNGVNPAPHRCESASSEGVRLDTRYVEERVREAAARARTIASAGGGTVAARRESALAFAADAISSLVLDHNWGAENLARLAQRTAHTFDLGPAAAGWALFLRAASVPQLLQLPPAVAIEVQLKLLAGLAPVSEVSLWAVVDGVFQAVASVGPSPTKRVRTVARDAFDTAAAACRAPRSPIHAVPVIRWRQPCAALVARALPDHREEVVAFLGEAATLLSPVLERELLLERSVGREHDLVSASERRLTRLGFDLHDGPLQDLAALADDLRVAQTQLSQVLTDDDRDVMRGCFEDLTTRLTHIDRGLRELSQSLESTSALELGLPAALKRELQNARRRSDIEIELAINGDLSALTASQRIAILRIVQEALTNIREHSGATRADIAVEAWIDHIQVRINDDGHGFDVSSTLVRAARRGRLGLVGMSERIRLLGGTFSIQSQIGRGTSIALTVPRWKPVLAGGPEALLAG